jgi:hypothetical protein
VKLENGQNFNPGDLTLLRVDDALQWEPNSAKAIAEGGESELIQPAGRPGPASGERPDPSSGPLSGWEALLDEVQAGTDEVRSALERVESNQSSVLRVLEALLERLERLETRLGLPPGENEPGGPPPRQRRSSPPR